MLAKAWRPARAVVEEVQSGQFREQTCSQSLHVLSVMFKICLGVFGLTSLELLVFLAEELVGTSRKHGQASLDHDGMINESHLDRAVPRR